MPPLLRGSASGLTGGVDPCDVAGETASVVGISGGGGLGERGKCSSLD